MSAVSDIPMQSDGPVFLIQPICSGSPIDLKFDQGAIDDGAFKDYLATRPDKVHAALRPFG